MNINGQKRTPSKSELLSPLMVPQLVINFEFTEDVSHSIRFCRTPLFHRDTWQLGFLAWAKLRLYLVTQMHQLPCSSSKRMDYSVIQMALCKGAFSCVWQTLNLPLNLMSLYCWMLEKCLYCNMSLFCQPFCYLCNRDKDCSSCCSLVG